MPKCIECGKEVRPGELSENFICPKCKLKKFGVANNVNES